MPRPAAQRQSLSVDLSRTYLDWAQANLALNGFDAGSHRLLQADCLAWLAEQRGRVRPST